LRAAEEVDVKHGVVEVFAYQETLLMMAVFGIAILAMIWVGFRRWIQYREKMGRLIGEQYGAGMERVEARLNAIEQIVTEGGGQTPKTMEALRSAPPEEPDAR
jgi:hypothetical protein